MATRPRRIDSWLVVTTYKRMPYKGNGRSSISPAAVMLTCSVTTWEVEEARRNLIPTIIGDRCHGVLHRPSNNITVRTTKPLFDYSSQTTVKSQRIVSSFPCPSLRLFVSNHIQCNPPNAGGPIDDGRSSNFKIKETRRSERPSFILLIHAAGTVNLLLIIDD